MTDFAGGPDGTLLAEGHGHTDADLRAGVVAALVINRTLTQAQAHAAAARIAETWYSPEAGFGHDCAGHADVPRAQWSAHCATLRPVTIADGIPAPVKVERAAPRPAAEAGVKGMQRRTAVT